MTLETNFFNLDDVNRIRDIEFFNLKFQSIKDENLDELAYYLSENWGLAKSTIKNYIYELVADPANYILKIDQKNGSKVRQMKKLSDLIRASRIKKNLTYGIQGYLSRYHPNLPKLPKSSLLEYKSGITNLNSLKD